MDLRRKDRAAPVASAREEAAAMRAMDKRRARPGETADAVRSSCAVGMGKRICSRVSPAGPWGGKWDSAPDSRR